CKTDYRRPRWSCLGRKQTTSRNKYIFLIKKGDEMNKILIVEDENSIAELERDYLEINGFQVDIASNGVTGLEKALTDNYKLIILDVMIPGMNGFELCKKIRLEKDIPILMVTAK